MLLHVDGRKYLFGDDTTKGKVIIEDITWDGLFTYEITVSGDVDVITDEDNINKSASYGIALRTNSVTWVDDDFYIVEEDEDGQPIDPRVYGKGLEVPEDIVVFGNDEIAVYREPHTKKFILSVSGEIEIHYEDDKGH